MMFLFLFMCQSLHYPVTFTDSGSLGTKWKGKGEGGKNNNNPRKQMAKKHDDIIVEAA